MRPHRWQPTRLRHPWDSPDKNTGVGCHFFLQCMKVKSESAVTQSCPILRDPMDCSLPGSSFHGIFQARVLEWGAIAFSKDGNLDLSNSAIMLSSFSHCLLRGCSPSYYWLPSVDFFKAKILLWFPVSCVKVQTVCHSCSHTFISCQRCYRVVAWVWFSTP